MRQADAVQALTIAELVARVHRTLARSFERVWVVGEVSNLRVVGGHSYFTLKDDRAQLAAVLFRGTAATLRVPPNNGLDVLVRGRVAIYEPRGALQIIVDSLEPRGLGALRQELERRRARLEADGLLAAERKRPLPFCPRCVGLVTALGGAAIHDMLVTLRRRMPNLGIVVRPVRVQGTGAAEEIAAGLRDLQSLPELEVVIIGRGGGSVEDLWAFNDEDLARAIVASRVPVISAVGHEIDVTLADLVADWRAPTPTAAAEHVVPRREDLDDRIEAGARRLVGAAGRRLERARRSLQAMRARLRDPRRAVALAASRARELDGRLERAARARLEAARGRFEGLERRLRSAAPRSILAEHRRALQIARHKLDACATETVRREREHWAVLGGRLSSLSPLAVLERGYAVVWKDGSTRAARSADELAAGDAIQARFARGGIVARVESTSLEAAVLGRGRST